MTKVEKGFFIGGIFLLIALPLLSFILIILCNMTSCSEDTTEVAKKEFSKYYNGKNEVVLIWRNILYFEGYNINLNDIKENEEPRGVIINKDGVLFSTSKQISGSNLCLNIYESDLTGKDINLIFSKEGYKTYPIVYANDDVFYIEHYLKSALSVSSKQIDTYNVITGEYKNIASGKDSNLRDYIIKEESIFEYSIEENESSDTHSLFKIKNTITNQEKIIDDDFLSKSIYIESLEIFNYSPKRVDISKGHILLTYSIGAGNGLNDPHLIFEYNFEEETLEYKCMVFPEESVAVKIVYIGI